MAKLFFTFLFCFALTACSATTPDNGPSEVTAVSATALDSEAVLGHVSGKTETWSKGGGYYAPDGTLSAVWDGKSSGGSWRLTDDGMICTKLDIWAPDEDCHTYTQQGEQVMLVYEGKATFREMFDGEQLDRF